MSKTSTAGQPDTIYEYDELGRQFRSGLDLNNNGKLDLASMDRIRESSNHYRKIDGNWWEEQKNIVYATDNSDAPTTTTTNRTRLTGWADRLIAEQISIDINNKMTISRESLNRHERERIKTSKYPDSTVPATQLYKNNLLISSVSKTGIKTLFGYDPLGRRIAVTDPRTGTSRTHYNERHRVDYVEDAAGNRTLFTYDPHTGLKTAETNPMGKNTFYEYTQHGQLARTWGDVPYPVEYRFNEYGEMVAMSTFRNTHSWDRQQWPKDAGGDKTLWEYQEATGLLLAKRDAKGYGTSYTYDQNNRLESRTWARSITTTYSYQSAGELQTIDYSDETADISFTYDRLGRKKTVTDALGKRTFTYNDLLQHESEEMDAELGTAITRSYDEYGRNNGFSLDEDYRISYQFDDTGRFAGLNWQVRNQVGSTSYRYLQESDLLSSHTSGENTITYEYEPRRNLKTAVRNTSNDSLISRYEYQYDRLGRRTNVSNSGSAFSDAAFMLFSYNTRNELQASSGFLGNDLSDQTRLIHNVERYYTYDPIGNRVLSIESKQKREYVTNKLNQYEQIQNSATTRIIYDLDGNLTESYQNNGSTRYMYNGENRLIQIEPVNPAENTTKSTYSYDYMGRRVEKKVFSSLAGDWQLIAHSFFIYEGWNLVAEVNRLNGTKTNYIWGLDLSQSLEGAGGIGGLLARVSDKSAYAYFYDANGNIGQVVDGAGTLMAAYEYDPFGNMLNSRDYLTDANPFRFSSKYFDIDSGLYYYGYRFYSPPLGRWVNRDPIGEKGGLNLYRFIENNSVNLLDKDGRAIYESYFYKWVKVHYPDVVNVDANSMRDLGIFAGQFSLSYKDIKNFFEIKSAQAELKLPLTEIRPIVLPCGATVNQSVAGYLKSGSSLK